MHYHLTAALQLPFADLQDLLEFRSPRPFCYRLFTPSCLWLVSRGFLSPETAVAGFEWGAFVLLYYVYRAYLREFMHGALAAYAALSVYFVIPFVFIIPQPFTVWFPWDIPSVCFFTAGLHLLYRERWAAWYVVFLLGTLNRETTVFLLPVFLLGLWTRGYSRRRAVHLAVSAVAWLSLKGVLAWLFRSQSGPWLAEWNHHAQVLSHWRENLGHLSDLALWPYLLSALGFVWILAWHLRGRVHDPFLRGALAVVPMYVLCVFLFANLAEHRIYADLIPVVLTPVLVSFFPVTNIKEGAHGGPGSPGNLDGPQDRRGTT